MPMSMEMLEKLEAYIKKHYKRVSMKMARHDSNHQKTLEEIEATIKKKEMFAKYFFDLIDKKEMSDVEAYKKARIDRRTFSKIRSNKDYMPSKQTLFAFSIALKLNLSETKKLLEHGGYSLSPSRKDDIIIEYFLKNNCYDIDFINEALVHYNYPVLGG